MPSPVLNLIQPKPFPAGRSNEAPRGGGFEKTLRQAAKKPGAEPATSAAEPKPAPKQKPSRQREASEERVERREAAGKRPRAEKTEEAEAAIDAETDAVGQPIAEADPASADAADSDGTPLIVAGTLQPEAQDLAEDSEASSEQGDPVVQNLRHRLPLTQGDQHENPTGEETAGDASPSARVSPAAEDQFPFEETPAGEDELSEIPPGLKPLPAQTKPIQEIRPAPPAHGPAPENPEPGEASGIQRPPVGELEVRPADASASAPAGSAAGALDVACELPDASHESGELLQAPASKAPSAAQAARPIAPAPQPHLPEMRFAEVNHPQIVSGVRQELLPNGGTMHLRLDPPELGAMQVTVRMLDGVMTATFQTGSDEAAKLLSHTLHQLKGALEAQGVSVDKLQVQQTPKDFDSSARNDGERSQGQLQYDQQARQEQQRRQLMERVWRRLSLGHDPLDMVA